MGGGQLFSAHIRFAEDQACRLSGNGTGQEADTSFDREPIPEERQELHRGDGKGVFPVYIVVAPLLSQYSVRAV